MDEIDDNATKYTLHGRELVEYLVQQAASDAKAALIERDERRNKRTAFLMSIIALVGVGGLVNVVKVYVRGELDAVENRYQAQAESVTTLIDQRAEALRAEFKASIKTSVATAVDDRVDKLMTTLEENDCFEQYAELAMQLPEKVSGISQRGDKYLAEALRETLAAAEHMAGIQRLTKRARFLMATRQIVDVMTRFNRESEINRLDDLLGEEMATDQELSRILVDHYGQLVVGSPQPIDTLADEMTRLNRYMRAAKELNYPEKALIWQLFTEFKRNNYLRNETTNRLLESTKDLSERDRAEFWYNLYVYTNPLNWMLGPDQQSRELARLMENLTQQYHGEGENVAQIMEQNLTNNPQLQTRLAELRAKNPAWQEQGTTSTGVTESASATAVPQPTQTPAETAAAEGRNDLR